MFLLIGIFVAFFISVLYGAKENLSIIQTFDLKALDEMFVKRKAVTPPGNVVIVAVDERSVNEIGRWPWTRYKMADLVTKLSEAKVVAIDIVFSESESPGADAALQDAVRANGNVVLGYFFRDDSTEVPDPLSLDQMGISKISMERFTGNSDGVVNETIVGFSGLEPNISTVGTGAAGFGSFNILDLDPDSVYRRVNLLYGYEGKLYPILAVEALRVALEDSIILNRDDFGVNSLSIRNYNIPADIGGEYRLNFYGKGGTFTTISAAEVFSDSFDKSSLKDKIVFVGVTETAMYDLRNTPVDGKFPGVEVHATLAGNVLEGRYLVDDFTVGFINVLLIIIPTLMLAYFISKNHKTYLSLLVFLAMLTLMILGEFKLFAVHSMMVSVVFPGASLFMTYILLETYRNIFVEKKGRYMKKAFSTYVSPYLVSEIMKDPDKLSLGGEKRVISVLFSDIRGFTAISENMSPDDLVILLNEYFNPMTRIVLDEQGTLDKYIGDAVMALYNAPVEIDNHPKRACESALQMVAQLPDLNKIWTGRGWPCIDIGVGVHTGEAVVGNMGGELRFDYTAIGDTVNLASRLEGMTKIYGVKIIVSEITYQSIRSDYALRELDKVRVKGKNEPVRIYELMGDHSNAHLTLMKGFAIALNAYRAGQFASAKIGFQKLVSSYPDDIPTRLYIDRCNEFEKNPPADGWDGVYVAATK